MKADGLLRAIESNPDDVALRLVYADWLEEQGNDQAAELVRVRVRLVQLPPFSGVTLVGGHEVRVGGQRVWVAGEPVFAPDEGAVIDAPPASITVAGFVPVWELSGPPPSSPPAIGQLATDLAFPLRFSSREAPRAVPDRGAVKAGPTPGLLRVRFTLYPFCDGEGVFHIREYSDPDEAERLKLRGREWELMGTIMPGALATSHE